MQVRPISGVASGTRSDRMPRAPAVFLRLTAAVGTVVGLLVLSVTPAGAAPAATKPDSRVTFGIEPAGTGASEIRSNFSLAATPGAIVDDNVAVLNFSAAPLALQLYPTDALETTAGGFGLAPAGTTPTGVGAWISLPPGSATVVVPAQTAIGPGRVIVPMTVHIPIKATPGDHVGGLVASLQTAGTSASGQRVVLDQRVGTRVFVRVSGTLTPKVVLTDVHADYEGTLNPVGNGNVLVSYVVRNAGNTDLAVDQAVRVSGPIADTRVVELPQVALLLPGASVAERVTLPGMWPQLLVHVTVTAQPMAEPGTSLPGLVTASASAWVWAIPWSLISIVVVVLLTGFGVSRIRRRRAGPGPAGNVETGQTAVEQPVGVGR